jgi:hypothetical protein
MKTPISIRKIMYKLPYKQMLVMLSNNSGLRNIDFLVALPKDVRIKSNLVCYYLDKLLSFELIGKTNAGHSDKVRYFITDKGLKLIEIYNLEQKIESMYKDLEENFIGFIMKGKRGYGMSMYHTKASFELYKKKRNEYLKNLDVR